VIESLGRDPNVALAVPAQKLFRDGFLVCGEHDAHFAYEQFGSWAVEPPIDYADVTEVEARAGMLGAELRVRVGYLSVRFSDISDADADAVARLIAARAGC
jgi:hypothetical protein